jgi:hypothetical protein
MMARRRQFGWVLLAAMAVAPGCDEMMGRGPQPPMYTLPKDTRVLVLVDVFEGLTPPPAFASALADRIGALLYTHKGVDKLVPQNQIVMLQQKEPARFKAMTTQDIARETGADVVLRVYLTNLQTQQSVDGQVVWGDALAYVKVIAKDGQKIWPGQATGQPVAAHVSEVEVEVKDMARVVKELGEQMAAQIGRMFYEWRPDKGEMTPRSF